jgi:hypothetical protein
VTVTPLLPKALYEDCLSIELDVTRSIKKEDAEHLFSFFQQCSLFRWSDANNDCEDRANAICMLLDRWNIPNYKGWVFSGAFLKRTSGNLVNLWNYHVAAVVPVLSDGKIKIFVIDPSTNNRLTTLYEWADGVTADECSYYLLRKSEDYIFSHTIINNDNWHKRNKQNYKWTLQGLAGINGVSAIGKAHLVFRKRKITEAENAFKDLMKKPVILKQN